MAEQKAPIGYTDTPRLPSGWRVHDPDRPRPVVVSPAPRLGDAPSDAIVLFDGSDLSQWMGVKEEKALWKIEDGVLVCSSVGDMKTRKMFSDCQLHIEWQTENPPRGDSQHRGNSGIFFMDRYEVQILDCFENPTYADGSAGAVYGQSPPLVNVCRKPGEWQTYDIVFLAPRFKGTELVSPAYVTVFLNGVLVQHKTEILGSTRHRTLPKYSPHEPTGPIRLQDHQNPTRFRNIWIREVGSRL